MDEDREELQILLEKIYGERGVSKGTPFTYLYFHACRNVLLTGYIIRFNHRHGRNGHLIGGGLIRGAGGWSGVKSLVKDGIFFKSDERMLGVSDLVENVLAEADEAMERKYALAAQ